MEYINPRGGRVLRGPSPQSPASSVRLYLFVSYTCHDRATVHQPLRLAVAAHSVSRPGSDACGGPVLVSSIFILANALTATLSFRPPFPKHFPTHFQHDGTPTGTPTLGVPRPPSASFDGPRKPPPLSYSPRVSAFWDPCNAAAKAPKMRTYPGSCELRFRFW